MEKYEDKKFYLESNNITLLEETETLRKEVSSVIELPSEKQRQIDLQYFTAIFVSSGENLNHAFFLPSEIVAAKDTIASKALDIEHEEDEIIGHLYDYAFTDKKGKRLNIKEIAKKDKASQDRQEIHVVIAGIIYKSRFPNIAQEVASGKWKVSMECYFNDYDVKVGDLILSKKEAEMLGFATNDDSNFGKVARVIKNKIEIASGVVTRVLRNICFSGCGIVKNPANPPSIILETANEKESPAMSDEVVVLDYDKLDQVREDTSESNNVTSANVEDQEKNGTRPSEEEAALESNDTVGICVSYKKEVIDATFKGPGVNVLQTDWCALYEKGCTSFSRDTTDPKCLRNLVRSTAVTAASKLFKLKESKDKRKVLVANLEGLLDKAKGVLKTNIK